MPDIIHLVRHGHHGLLDSILCGRMPGVGIDELGRRQLSQVALSLRPAPLRVEASPQLRAQQSAQIIAAHFGLDVLTAASFDEIDMGDWTGTRFDDLTRDQRWSDWNARRGSTRPPNGETMVQLQTRVVGHLEKLRDTANYGAVVIVSHAEPIRTAVLHYSGTPLDQFQSVSIVPASITTLVRNGGALRLVGVGLTTADMEHECR